ncbi:putative multitransmembrane protein [Halobacteroides halobius DSM 5150]|uniref:Putative multitransmembrane protein n=1 Tax=Halobacteroides halobius (strain ATCC 35273 / DSM 5150 / MD-1) TaxID=748449 RepID=L0K463_HALHC|nr:YibE/F family protein [Halobacteroides halobius]AGB40077.1 putative multitransmembrane protein [Halobacteroides halobius DSM 5150]
MKKINLKTTIIILSLIIISILFINNLRINKADNLSKAIVLKTNNSNVISSGVTNIGHQILTVKVLEGGHTDSKLKASNHFTGTAEIDNYYQEGDEILISIKEKQGKVTAVKAVDLYRQHWELLLFGLFVLILILYAGYTGLRALFSFVASVYIIWNILIPGLLAGQNPLLLSSFVLVLLTGIIIFSIAGFTRKGLAALAGTLSGLFITIVITIVFGNNMGLRGMTAPFSQTLLFSGHIDLNMKHIFYASIIIGASGAAMDIAMDIAASMEEIKLKKPDIEMKELIQSGFNVGRAVIGTMTTTLLLAYSGGYLTLLMLFVSKNTSLRRIINFKMVSAEILRTLTGSIGLVLVAPITALFAGWIYCSDFFIITWLKDLKSHLKFLRP